MGQGDSDAEKNRAADNRADDFVAESVHVALHQSHDWRIDDCPTAQCATAHATDVSSTTLSEPVGSKHVDPLMKWIATQPIYRARIRASRRAGHRIYPFPLRSVKIERPTSSERDT